MTVICCNQCFHNIASKDTGAATLWMELCAFYVQHDGDIKLKEYKVPNFIPRFRKLEKLGYISTADGESISIRVNGYGLIDQDDECIDTFCIDREKHSADW